MITACQRVISSAANCVKDEIAGLGRAAQSREGIDKLFKLCIGFTDASQYIIGNTLLPFKAPLKMFVEFGSSLNSICRLNDFVNNLDKHKGALKMAKLVTLTIGHGLETVKFLHTVHIIDLGQFAAKTCTLTLFRVSVIIPGIGIIKDVAIGASSILGIVISCKKLSDPTLNRRQQAIQFKIDACKNELALARVEVNSPEENALLRNMNECDDKYSALVKDHPGLIKMEKKLKKAQIAQNTTGNTDTQYEINVCEWKIKTWKELKKMSINEKKKAQISIINDVFKLVLISLSLSSLFIAPVFLVPGFVVFGLLAGITGYRKFCIETSSVSLTPKPQFA
jgi:hypothetical protein